jgi:uncharacterized protein (TIGR02453 family)
MTEFPWAGVELLRGLAANNNREWFTAHKAAIAESVTEPVRSIVEELETLLSAETGKAMGSKIYRMHRDLRFSKDKTPYNAHIRFSVVPREGNSVAFHFSMEPDRMVVGTGLCDASDKLDSFRKRAAEFDALLRPGFRLDEPELKKVPAGWPSDSPHAEHLRRKYIAAWIDRPWVEGKGATVDPEHLHRLLPLWHWLAEL